MDLKQVSRVWEHTEHAISLFTTIDSLDLVVLKRSTKKWHLARLLQCPCKLSAFDLVALANFHS
jgi:hypothetical protein